MENEDIVNYLNGKDFLVNKIGAGLRRMTVSPDALLFFDKQDLFYDRKSICNIPIYRTNFIYQCNEQEELSFYPIFKDVYFDSTIEVTNFRRGYEEF